MPMSSWEEVAGKRCSMCKTNWATHWYFGRLLCCECHGGYICTNEQASEMHDKVLKEHKHA